jgi:hypothetical protein
MRISDYSKQILALAETLHRWAGALASLDGSRREKVAKYADEIAATLARASAALEVLETDPENPKARHVLVREFGRISGYVETIVGVLQHHLDGRKLAGVKRRLEQLRPGVQSPPAPAGPELGPKPGLDRLLAAEGYFRALADGLRT